jgi:hypothetical protein
MPSSATRRDGGIARVESPAASADGRFRWWVRCWRGVRCERRTWVGNSTRRTCGAGRGCCGPSAGDTRHRRAVMSSEFAPWRKRQRLGMFCFTLLGPHQTAAHVPSRTQLCVSQHGRTCRRCAQPSWLASAMDSRASWCCCCCCGGRATTSLPLRWNTDRICSIRTRSKIRKRLSYGW